MEKVSSWIDSDQFREWPFISVTYSYFKGIVNPIWNTISIYYLLRIVLMLPLRSINIYFYKNSSILNFIEPERLYIYYKVVNTLKDSSKPQEEVENLIITFFV